MKGIKLIILIMLVVGFVSPVLLQVTAPGAFGSWSQYADNWNDPFLEMGLLAIILTFFSLALVSPDKNKFIFTLTIPAIKFLKVLKQNVNIRLKHIYRFTAFMFCGVMMFDAGGGFWSDLFHYIFTLAGAAAIFVSVVRFYSKGFKQTLAAAVMGMGALAWLIGFTTSLWTIFLGEVIFYLCSLPFIITEYYKAELNE